jgi:hypothetical protein
MPRNENVRNVRFFLRSAATWGSVISESCTPHKQYKQYGRERGGEKVQSASHFKDTRFSGRAYHGGVVLTESGAGA